MERQGQVSTRVTPGSNPVVRRRELAALLRELRTEAGLTVEEVAGELLCSPSKVSRMETGQRTVSLRDVRDLCALYRVSGQALREHLIALAKGSKEQGWWQPYDIPASLANYVGLEADATCISNYEPGVIPGLLQTPAYARAVHDRTIPRPADVAIDKFIEVRRSRQEILTREEPPPPQFRGIVDEAALHRVVGGPAVMRAALEHVVRACELPNVRLQVLSYASGAHPALDSTFVLLEFGTPLPPVVYVEGLVGQIWLERPPDARRYKEVFERLAEMSLSIRKSVDFIAELAASYKEC